MNYQGALIEPQGKYEGDFKNGLKHGKGLYSFKNGTKYKGDYCEGKREGSGIVFHANDSIAYDGEIRDGLPHGKGYVFDANGKKE